MAQEGGKNPPLSGFLRLLKTQHTFCWFYLSSSFRERDMGWGIDEASGILVWRLRVRVAMQNTFRTDPFTASFKEFLFLPHTGLPQAVDCFPSSRLKGFFSLGSRTSHPLPLLLPC